MLGQRRAEHNITHQAVHNRRRSILTDAKDAIKLKLPLFPVLAVLVDSNLAQQA